MRSSEILANLCRLVNEGAIGYYELDGFSEKLREDVIRITSYNAHGSEKFGGNCDEDKTTDGRYFMSVCSCNRGDESFPLSVMLALSMTANGAKGETLVQMETLLGGDIPMETLNEYLYSYIKALPSEKTAKLNSANSIWFRDNGFTAEKAFLQKNADYYGLRHTNRRSMEKRCGISTTG